MMNIRSTQVSYNRRILKICIIICLQRRSIFHVGDKVNTKTNIHIYIYIYIYIYLFNINQHMID